MRLSALILDHLKFLANFSNLSQGLSNGRCPWYVNISVGVDSERSLSRMPSLHILAWASALPSDFIRAMREASDGRTATDTDSYAFLFNNFCSNWVDWNGESFKTYIH